MWPRSDRRMACRERERPSWKERPISSTGLLLPMVGVRCRLAGKSLPVPGAISDSTHLSLCGDDCEADKKRREVEVEDNGASACVTSLKRGHVTLDALETTTTVSQYLRCLLAQPRAV